MGTHLVLDVGQGAAQDLLGAQRPVGDHRHRGVGRSAVLDERGGEQPHPLDGHQQHHGAAQPTHRRPVHQRARVVGGDVPGDHHHLVRHSPVRHGHVGGRGNGEGAGDAGNDGHRDPGGHARLHLLEPAAEQVRIPTLEPHDELAGAGVLDQRGVDVFLGHGAAVGDLRGVDDLDVGRQLVQQLRRAQPVGDDDVGPREQPAPAHRDEVGVARPPADQGHPGGDRLGGVVHQPRLQRLQQRGPHGSGAARPTARQHTQGQPVVLGRRRGGRRPEGRVVRPHAEHPAALGLGQHGRVHLRIGGGGQCVPRTLEVTRGVGTLLPDQLPGLGHALDRRGGRRGDHHDVRPGGEQTAEAALRHRAGPDHDDAAAAQLQPDQVRAADGVRHGRARAGAAAARGRRRRRSSSAGHRGAPRGSARG